MLYRATTLLYVRLFASSLKGNIQRLRFVRNNRFEQFEQYASYTHCRVLRRPIAGKTLSDPVNKKTLPSGVAK
jgi:hypothetical protein